MCYATRTVSAIALTNNPYDKLLYILQKEMVICMNLLQDTNMKNANYHFI